MDGPSCERAIRHQAPLVCDAGASAVRWNGKGVTSAQGRYWAAPAETSRAGLWRAQTACRRPHGPFCRKRQKRGLIKDGNEDRGRRCDVDR
jgi:hypothetical protein